MTLLLVTKKLRIGGCRGFFGKLVKAITFFSAPINLSHHQPSTVTFQPPSTSTEPPFYAPHATGPTTVEPWCLSGTVRMHRRKGLTFSLNNFLDGQVLRKLLGSYFLSCLAFLNVFLETNMPNFYTVHTFPYMSNKLKLLNFM